MCSESESGFWVLFKKHRGRRIQFFYEQENNNLLDRSKLVCTRDDLAKLKDIFNKTDVIESCSKEKLRKNWTFYKLTNLTYFAVLLKDVPMVWRNAVLPEPNLSNGTNICLAYEENTRTPYTDNLCFFRAPVHNLHDTQRLEKEISKFFKLFIKKRTDGAPISCIISRESTCTISFLLKIC